jgi:hypothetical protein
MIWPGQLRVTSLLRYHGFAYSKVRKAALLSGNTLKSAVFVFHSPILPYDSRVRFWGSDLAAFWHTLTWICSFVPKTLEFGTIACRASIGRKAHESMLLHYVLKPVFQFDPAGGV